jgi:hypothetical protein
MRTLTLTSSMLAALHHRSLGPPYVDLNRCSRVNVIGMRLSATSLGDRYTQTR